MNYFMLQNLIRGDVKAEDLVTDRSDLPLTTVGLHLPGWQELDWRDQLILTEFLELVYLKAVSPPDPVEIAQERFLRRKARKGLNRLARRVVDMAQDAF